MKNNQHQRKQKDEIICRCNTVSRSTIEKAILGGCDTMNKIFDCTSAGVGPCGGSCRRKLKPFLDYYLEHKVFPEKIVEDLTGKVQMGVPRPAEMPPKKSSDENQ